MIGRYSKIEDPQLVAACLRGDAQAWDALIDRYRILVYSVPRRLGMSEADAEDVFQDVFLILFNHLAAVRETEKLAGWLVATTRRECWRRVKRRRHVTEADLPEETLDRTLLAAADPGEGPDEAAAAAERQQAIRESLAELGGRCRDLIEALYVREPPLSYVEVVERLGIPIGSIGPTRARCLERIRKLLEVRGF
jgi:RNA polymerase sigma factor (sigma-70 family)